MEKHKVQKSSLLMIAGLVWMLAGFMVVKTGLPFLKASSSLWPTLIGAALIFLIFYLLIFSKLVQRHETRIKAYQDERIAFWLFSDTKQYLIIAVMMSGGILIRSLHLAPDWFIAFFYPGLGLALFSCGTRFVARSMKYDNP